MGQSGIPRMPRDSALGAVGYGAYASDTPSALEQEHLRLAVARGWVSARAGVVRIFSPDLAQSAAWDILLDLYICHANGRPVVVSSLCSSAHSPQSTALRWLRVLEDLGLVDRITDSSDKRRSIMSLTEEGLRKMHDALDASSESDKKIGLGRLNLSAPPPVVL